MIPYASFGERGQARQPVSHWQSFSHGQCLEEDVNGKSPKFFVHLTEK